MTVYLALFWMDGASLSGVKYASFNIDDTIKFAVSAISRTDISDLDYKAYLLTETKTWMGDVLLHPTNDTGSFLLFSVEVEGSPNA